MKEKILIFGTDGITEKILNQVFESESKFVQCGGIGFVDNLVKMDLFYNLPVVLPKELERIEFDKIVICNGGNYGVIRNELIYGYGISPDKIESANYLIRLRCIDKYSDVDDAEVQQTVRNLESQKYFNIWCGYCERPREKYEVFWDKATNMPYVIFENKKMYYPRDYSRFKVSDGKMWVYGLEFEQQSGSPHTYITDEIKIEQDDIVIDAGVCEGNFAIKYIDKIKKVVSYRV